MFHTTSEHARTSQPHFSHSCAPALGENYSHFAKQPHHARDGGFKKSEDAKGCGADTLISLDLATAACALKTF